MGRLFWKIFLAFWLTQVLMGAAVGVVFYIHNQQRLAEMTELAGGPRARRNIALVAVTLHYGGVAALRELAREWPRRRGLPVYVVDAAGQDVLGRTVPAAALSRARSLLRAQAQAAGVRRVQVRDGQSYVLFVPAEVLSGEHRFGHHRLPLDPLALRLLIASLAGLLFSAGLAWYLTRPLRHVRSASRQLADGVLETRVMPVLGRRRDEIGDLGRDFDHMAGRLQALVGAQKRLLHDVSHELRSPLARLQVAVGLARQQPGKIDTALQRIERESERLDELVGQLLTLSRLEAGVVQAPEEQVDVRVLLQDIVADAQFEAQGQDRAVRLTADQELPVRGRAELLHRALENIVRNGVAYTAADTAVEVCADITPDRRRLRVSVCDRGPGVAEASLTQLFEPFVRLAEAGSETPPRGYGLGLAIARRAIEAHGGSVRAHNRPGGGLCVELELPAAREAHSTD
jgi:two-component system OmpR family sensor kinase